MIIQLPLPCGFLAPSSTAQDS